MSHIFKSLDNDDMEIGQTTGQDLFIKLNRWGGECKINMDLAGDKSATIQQISADELRWVGNKFDFKFEKKSPKIEFVGSKKKDEMPFIFNERNGVELFIILKEKPVQNYVEFPVDIRNLNYYKQPPLTQESIDAGHVRSPLIDGSYAVYHKTKKNHVIGQTNYMAGKAFHIYRPIVMDNNNNLTFGELDIVDGKMRITVDSDFIQNAVYPVTIDPNFGYETQGTFGYQDFEDIIVGRSWLNNQGVGTGDSISACVYINNQKMKCALYDYDGPANYIQTTDERSDITEKAKAYYTFNFSSSPDISNNTTYNLLIWGDETGGGGYGRLFYDFPGDLGNDAFNVAEAYGAWPGTVTQSSRNSSVVHSLYCTFTESAPPSGFIPKVIGPF